MTCLNPITAWQKRFADLTQSPNDYYNDKKIKFKKPGANIIQNYQEIKIACGHCLGCRLDHANQWATRIAKEIQNHKDNCFVTLTYANEKLPLTNTGKMTLRKKDFQDFIKRLRYHTDKKILYFACGEYGPTTFRPHYHAIIMGWKPDDLKESVMSKTGNSTFTSKKLENIWQNGFVNVQEANYKTACYVARYVQKKAGIKPTKRYATNEISYIEKIDERTKKPFIRIKNTYKTENKDEWGRQKEFILMSKKPAIGKDYWDINKKNLKITGNIPIKIEDSVKLKTLPRYYKKLWEKEDIWDYVYGNYKILEKIKKSINENLEKIAVNDKDNAEKKYLQIIKDNLEQKSRFLKRNQN